MPVFTQGAPDYDVVGGGRREPTCSASTCPTTPGIPRPVVGTVGLVPTAWSRVHEQWGGTQLQRPLREARRPLDDRARLQRLGRRARVRRGRDPHPDRRDPAEAARLHAGRRSSSSAPSRARALSFRRWDQQLREPMLLVTPRMLVSVSPQEQFLHRRNAARHAGLRPAREPLPPESLTRARKSDARHAHGARHAGHRPPWQSCSGAAQARELFVTNEKGNSVTVIDGDDARGHARPSRSATGRAASSSAPTASISTSAPRTTTRSRSSTPTTPQVVGDLPSGPDPEQLSISPDGKTLYVANEDDNMVTVIDVESRTQVDRDPGRRRARGHGRSATTARWVVNTSETTNMAHFIDVATYEIIDNVLVDQRPRYAEFTTDDAEVWVSSEVGGTVSVIDNTEPRKVTTRSPSRSRGVPQEAIRPVGIRITKDRKLGVRGAGRRQPGRRHRRPDLSRSRSTCWSASASGSWPSARTRRCSTRRTASPTTSRSSTSTASRS